MNATTHEAVYDTAFSAGLDIGMMWDTPLRTGCDSAWAARDLCDATGMSPRRAVRVIRTVNAGGRSKLLPPGFVRVTDPKHCRQH